MKELLRQVQCFGENMFASQSYCFSIEFFFTFTDYAFMTQNKVYKSVSGEIMEIK